MAFRARYGLADIHRLSGDINIADLRPSRAITGQPFPKVGVPPVDLDMTSPTLNRDPYPTSLSLPYLILGRVHQVDNITGEEDGPPLMELPLDLYTSPPSVLLGPRVLGEFAKVAATTAEVVFSGRLGPRALLPTLLVTRGPRQVLVPPTLVNKRQ